MTRDSRLVREELRRLLTREVEHLGDVLASVRDIERVAVVARALADLTRDVHVGKKVHLDLDRAVARTRFAPSPAHVERKTSGEIPADLRLLCLAEEPADVVEHSRVRRGIGARRAPDRRLVDVDDLVEVLETLDRLVAAGGRLRLVDALHERGEQYV